MPEPPAFYPVSLNLAGRRCVVIGAPDDREAIEKTRDLRESGADVVWITDPAALRDADVADAFFVISTPQDAALSARLRALADAHRFLLCAIDQPAFGFVAMQAIVKSGPARIAISATHQAACPVVAQGRSSSIFSYGSERHRHMDRGTLLQNCDRTM